jgi:hypothetical protein
MAAFCRLDKSLSHSEQMGWLVGAVGIELLDALKARRLLILLNRKNAENTEFAQRWYTRGTRKGLDSLAAKSYCRLCGLCAGSMPS